MFIREKRIKGYSYLYLVESVREDGRTKQRIIKNLGRKEAVLADGGLDRLAASVARYAEHAMVLSAVERGDRAELSCRRIGAPLLFERLWRETGIGGVLDALLAERGFEFAVERAVFTAVLHRLLVSGSDRACEKWMDDYRIDGAGGLQLHHFYRAMAWLGEELDEPGDAISPRCVKDVIEEMLFERRRDLFSDLSVVFMDTTSLSFTGEGGKTLGERGFSKDHRPDLKQMLLGAVIDGEGRPVCSEMWPGNTADVTTLIPVVDRLRRRFAIGRVCVVADRGMISKETIAALEARKLEYILGARERSDKIVRDLVLNDDAPMVPLLVERQKGETQLFVKEVRLGDARYIVCRNEAEARKDKADRVAIITGLQKQLRKGDKTLLGNSAYRKFLRMTTKHAFEIDPGKVADEARFDGIFVLRINARITPLQAVLRYRDLLQVESLFRQAKALMHTRPIYHSSDAAIRGHVFCSFLALVMKKDLLDRCRARGFYPEWGDVLRDLDRLQDVTINKDGKDVTLRTAAAGVAGKLFQCTGVALPQNVRETDNADAS